MWKYPHNFVDINREDDRFFVLSTHFNPIYSKHNKHVNIWLSMFLCKRWVMLWKQTFVWWWLWNNLFYWMDTVCLFVCFFFVFVFLFLFVCLVFIVPLENCSLIWESQHYRWRAADFDLCSVFMTIEQWRFFSVPHLLWHGPSVYNGHLRGPMPLKLIT